MPALTSTSYAVLALLALQSWTTYQLARQMERSLGWIWPRAISRLYEEPKKLVAAGLATSRSESTGPRCRAPSTRSRWPAVRHWPPGSPSRGRGMVLECEALVKIAYADQGTREGLLANLTALIDDTTAKLHFGEMIARQYLDGLGPFQERLPLSGLMWRFLWEFQLTALRWARWAYAEVEGWPQTDLSQLDAIAEFTRIVAAAGSPLHGTWVDGRCGRRDMGTGAPLADGLALCSRSPLLRSRRSPSPPSCRWSAATWEISVSTGWVFSAFLLASLIGIVVAGTLADRVPLGRPTLAALGPVRLRPGHRRDRPGHGGSRGGEGGAGPWRRGRTCGRLRGDLPVLSRGVPAAHVRRPLHCMGGARPDGPPVAALVAAAVGWRWAFFGLLPLVIAAGVLVVLALRHVPPPASPGTAAVP